MNYFQSVRRIKEEKETTKEASVGASLALGCFLKKASPQLGFPNIISLIRQSPVPRQLLLKIRETKEGVSLLIKKLKFVEIPIDKFVLFFSVNVDAFFFFFFCRCLCLPFGKEADVRPITSSTLRFIPHGEKHLGHSLAINKSPNKTKTQ